MFGVSRRRSGIVGPTGKSRSSRLAVSWTDATCGQPAAGLRSAVEATGAMGRLTRRRWHSSRRPPSARAGSAQPRPALGWSRCEAATRRRATAALRLRRNSMRIACYRSTSSFPSMRCFSCAPAEAPPSRSSRHAPPDSASQLTNQTTGFGETNSANGAATQMLMQLKQSIRLPMNPSPKPAAQPEDDVRRAVLVRQQVGDPPGREDGQDEVAYELIRQRRLHPACATLPITDIDPSVPANAESHRIFPCYAVNNAGRESGCRAEPHL